MNFTFRKIDKLYKSILSAQLEVIFEVTGCKRPCYYSKYTFLGDKKITGYKSDYFIFSLSAFFNHTILEKEQLIYPLSSLVDLQCIIVYFS